MDQVPPSSLIKSDEIESYASWFVLTGRCRFLSLDGATLVNINVMFRGISDISDNKMVTFRTQSMPHDTHRLFQLLDFNSSIVNAGIQRYFDISRRMARRPSEVWQHVGWVSPFTQSTVATTQKPARIFQFNWEWATTNSVMHRARRKWSLKKKILISADWALRQLNYN